MTRRNASPPSECVLRQIADLPIGEQRRIYDALMARAAAGERVVPDAPIRGVRGRPRGGFVHHLERARTYELLLGTRKFPSMRVLARAEGISGERVAQFLAMLRLAPDILERLERGEAPLTEIELRLVTRVRSHEGQRRVFERLVAAAS